MDRMSHDDLKDYRDAMRLEDLPVSTLLDFHDNVRELKEYCMDLLDCFGREQRYSDESINYSDVCAKETELIEDMELLLKKIVSEHSSTMKTIRRYAQEKREEFNTIKIKKEAK